MIMHKQNTSILNFQVRVGENFGRRGGSVPVVKPKNLKTTLKRLWFYVSKEKKWLAIIFAVILVDSGLTLLVPYLLGKSIDAMSVAKEIANNAKLEYFIIILLAVYIADALLTLFRGWFMAEIAQRMVSVLRRTLFEKLQKLPIGFFDNRSHGEIMSRLSNDIDNVSNTISQTVAQLMSGCIAIVGSFIMMLLLSPILTLASLITVPLVFLLTNTITIKTGILFKEQQIQLGKLNGHIEESISGIEMIKSFNHEARVIEEFDNLNEKLCQVGLKAQIWSGFLMPIMNVINNIGFAMIAIVGGILALKSLITVGVIASFLSYSRQFIRPLNDLANIFNILQSGVAGAERVFEVFDEQEETADFLDAIVLKNPKGNVVFENVSFGYRADVPILKNISFTVKAGSSIALVGPTGSGKTTIVNLISRFYDVTYGRILLDGKDIREYTRDSLRLCFGIVLQDTYLFAGTVKENIKYGNEQATDKEIEAAAVMANANIFIKRLPKQYDTMLSENGGNLSQGQRQLLAIARAILTKPSILILDEATSSIDTLTELYIQDALSYIMKGRTTFIIAHRLNTIRNADIIMVIDDGEVIEKGNHQELMNRKGIYYNMVKNQFKNIV